MYLAWSGVRTMRWLGGWSNKEVKELYILIISFKFMIIYTINFYVFIKF